MLHWHQVTRVTPVELIEFPPKRKACFNELVLQLGLQLLNDIYSCFLKFCNETMNPFWLACQVLRTPDLGSSEERVSELCFTLKLHGAMVLVNGWCHQIHLTIYLLLELIPIT